MGAGRAAQELGVGQHTVAHAVLAGIFALGIHIGIADIDRADFVHADATGENLLFASGGVKEPLSVLLHQWNRKRPAVRANFQRDVGIRIGDQLRLVVIELHRKTSVREIIEALRKHAKAIDSKVFNQKFEVPNINFVLSIHMDQSRLDNTLKHIKDGDFPNFARYMAGFNFATVEELIKGSINESLYQLDGAKGRIFEIS